MHRGQLSGISRAVIVYEERNEKKEAVKTTEIPNVIYMADQGDRKARYKLCHSITIQNKTNQNTGKRNGSQMIASCEETRKESEETC